MSGSRGKGYEPPRCEYCRHWRGKHRVCPAPAGRRATPNDKAECRVRVVVAGDRRTGTGTLAKHEVPV